MTARVGENPITGWSLCFLGLAGTGAGLDFVLDGGASRGIGWVALALSAGVLLAGILLIGRVVRRARADAGPAEPRPTRRPELLPWKIALAVFGAATMALHVVSLILPEPTVLVLATAVTGGLAFVAVYVLMLRGAGVAPRRWMAAAGAVVTGAVIYLIGRVL